MTKDRRLGRGLAALLGTQIEDGSTENANSPEIMDGSLGTSQEAQTSRENQKSRSDTIRSLADETRNRISPTRSSLSPVTVPLSSAHPNASSTATLDLQTTLIDANPFQPRRQFNPSEIESLAESLKEHKQLQPILVRRVGERYQLISGERRLRATVFAGLPTIRAEVREADDRLVAELSIIENLQRKDLNAIEKALSFKRYITEHKCTQDELAQRLKIDRSTIANMMRLLELPDTITDAVQRDEVSAGHAKALLSLGSIREQISFLKKIREEGWSVRETEARVAEAIAAAADSEEGYLGAIPRRKATKSDLLSSLENEIKMNLGTRVDKSNEPRSRSNHDSLHQYRRVRSPQEYASKRPKEEGCIAG